MLSSRQINTDPTPLYTVTLTGQDGSRYAGQSFTWEMRSRFEADAISTAHGVYPGCDLAGVTVQYNRPEFDNTPNPLLVALRQCMATCPEDCVNPLAWVEWLWQNDRAEGNRPEHIEHARKVLTRLEAAAA